MALRAVPDHPKFAELKALLRLPKGAVLGWLESVWHFTGRFTPHGNIGKYTDAAIEAWVEWDGEPGALISAMIQTRWIDRDTEYRLLVHDWHIHADNATKMAVSRSKKPFCLHTVETTSQHCGDAEQKLTTALELPVPVPESVPVPEPKTKGRKRVPVVVVLPEGYPAETWAAFLEMRKQIRKPATDQAEMLVINELKKLSKQGNDVRDVLERSIRSNWADVYPLRGKAGFCSPAQKDRSPRYIEDPESAARAEQQSTAHGRGAA